MSLYQDQNAINTKWIAFSILLSGGYWVIPSRNKYVAITLLYFGYLAISWYDYLFAQTSFKVPTYMSKLFSWAYPPHTTVKFDSKIQKNILFADVFLYFLVLLSIPFILHWEPSPEDTNTKTRNAWIVFAVCAFTFLFLRYTYN